jgi:hypothetical protein
MRIAVIFVLVAAAGTLGGARPAAAPQNSSSTSSSAAADRPAAESANRKFQKIQTNANRPRPDQAPTVLTEREINAYVNTYVELPKGVERATFTGSSGVITTNATVNFDEVTHDARSSNPLLALFRGTHEVQVVSHAQGRGGEGQVQIDSVSISGVEVPQIALEFFIDKYITPRYPNLGMDSRFGLPARIDTATVGNHVLTVTQK